MKRGVLVGTALLIGAGSFLLKRNFATRTQPLRPARQTDSYRSAPRIRSILELSGREANGCSWTALWCYLPRVRIRTVYTWQRNQSVQERVESLSRQPRSQGQTSFNDEWAALNGGYFDWNNHDLPARAIIGSVGNGELGAWSHGSPPSSRGKRFQRWAFGVRQDSRGETRFGLALMQRRAGFTGYQVPASIENTSPYGLSGLMCLLCAGEPMVWRDSQGLHALPEGQWNGRTEFMDGYFRRAALAWSADGRSLFMVVQRSPHSVLDTRDLFARYKARQYSGPGPLLAALRTAYWQLSATQRPCPPDALPHRIENAVMLDGGRCATLMYRHLSAGKPPHDWGSWQTGAPTRRTTVRVPTTIEVAER